MLQILSIEDRESTALNIISIILSYKLNIVMGIFVGSIFCCFTSTVRGGGGGSSKDDKLYSLSGKQDYLEFLILIVSFVTDFY